MKYKDLEIWKLSRQLAVEIHHLSIRDIPKFEMFETGSQIRRSMKSVSANLVEGYGRRRYKSEFIRFLIIAEASLDETTEHLEILFETGSLQNKETYDTLHNRLELLGRMFNSFISKVESSHKT